MINRGLVEKLLPIGWMMVVYGGTTLLAKADPAPCCGIPRAIFETRHALTHLATFTLEGWLLCRAVTLTGNKRLSRPALALIGLGLAIGFGQETLQTLLRNHLLALDSLWDLTVDLAGSALGWWLYTRRPKPAPVG